MKKFNLLFVWSAANIFTKLKRRGFIFLVCGLCLFILLLLSRWHQTCSDTLLKDKIQEACKNYGQGLSVGTLCPALCEKGSTLQSSLSCHSMYSSGHSVFAGNLQNASVILKYLKPSKDITDYELMGVNDKKTLMKEDFISMIKTNIKLKYNINSMDITKVFNFRYPTNFVQEQLLLLNMWPLMQDNEYLGLKLYEAYDVFPKLIGSCGSFYAVQKMRSISRYGHLITLYDSQEEWKKRVIIGVKILELLQVLENDMPEPLYICDVKLSHFGLTDDLKKVKYLDIHAVHPYTVINKITGDGSPCADHKDCDFLDCRTFCNLVTLKCQHGVANNNIQIVCEKIFLGWVVPGHLIVPGLLLGPHAPNALVQLLELCANPASETGTPRASTSVAIQKRLLNLLRSLSQP